MCPDWESNPWPFGSQADSTTNWTTLARAPTNFLIIANSHGTIAVPGTNKYLIGVSCVFLVHILQIGQWASYLHFLSSSHSGLFFLFALIHLPNILYFLSIINSSLYKILNISENLFKGLQRLFGWYFPWKLACFYVL